MLQPARGELPFPQTASSDNTCNAIDPMPNPVYSIHEIQYEDGVLSPRKPHFSIIRGGIGGGSGGETMQLALVDHEC